MGLPSSGMQVMQSNFRHTRRAATARDPAFISVSDGCMAGKQLSPGWRQERNLNILEVGFPVVIMHNDEASHWQFFTRFSFDR